MRLQHIDRWVVDLDWMGRDSMQKGGYYTLGTHIFRMVSSFHCLVTSGLNRRFVHVLNSIIPAIHLVIDKKMQLHITRINHSYVGMCPSVLAAKAKCLGG